MRQKVPYFSAASHLSQNTVSKLMEKLCRTEVPFRFSPP
jgi:hypothetical protein